MDLNSLNKDLWKEIFDTQDLLSCFNCGTCISGCPASRADPPLLIRNLARMVILGMEDELFDEDTPWFCVTCSRCEEMCPMDVKPFELCLAVRKWQSENDETRVPQSLVEIYTRGYTQPVGANPELRASLGLPETLPTLDQYPDQLQAFQDMLMKTKVVQDNDFMFS